MDVPALLRLLPQLARISGTVANIMPILPQADEAGLAQAANGQASARRFSYRLRRHNNLNRLSFFTGQTRNQYFPVL